MSKRITPSLIISVIALVIALGGVGYAAVKIPRNSVGAKQLKKNSVNSSKVTNGSLLRSDFDSGEVSGDAWWAGLPGVQQFSLTNQQQTVASISNLPAGSYVIQARANLTAYPQAAGVNCFMESDTAQGFTIPQDTNFPLSMAGVQVLTKPGSIQLTCSLVEGTAYVTQANLIATSVNSIQGWPPS